MPSQETITKWVCGIIAGAVLALQGVNWKTTSNVEAEQKVSAQEIAEAVQEIHQIHSVIGEAMARQQEIDQVVKELRDRGKTN